MPHVVPVVRAVGACQGEVDNGDPALIAVASAQGGKRAANVRSGLDRGNRLEAW